MVSLRTAMLRKRAVVIALAGTLAVAPLPVSANNPSTASTPMLKPCPAVRCGADLVFIGTQGSGPGQGILVARFDPRSGALHLLGLGAELARPTWLSADPARPVLWSVSDPGADSALPSRLVAYAVDPLTGTLRQLSGTAPGGKGPTNLAYDAASRTLFVANYASGSTAAVPVLADGSLDEAASSQSNYGTGPHRRQTSPHAHGVAYIAGRRTLLVPDLGADRMFLYRFDPRRQKLVPAPMPYVQLPAGSGPRHVAATPDGRFVYLITELIPAIAAFRWTRSGDGLEPIATVPTMPDDAEDRNKGAEIAVSGDGRFLYTSNRGEDFIAVHAINTKTGTLREVQKIPSGGQLPWSFVLHRSGRWMLVANQASGTVTVFARDPATGRLTATGNTVTAAKATSLAFAARR